MAATFDDALEALRREHFYRAMAEAQDALRGQPEAWAEYMTERDAWLGADLGAS